MSTRTTKTLLIANPAAGRGRARKILPHVREALAARGVIDVKVTTSPGEERGIAESASRAGIETIIALGGDGTWGNVARGIIAAGGNARLALLAAGTGNDLAFVSEVPAHDISTAIAIALSPGERRLDVGEADGVIFVNCVGFGFDAEVVRRIGEVRWARGHAVYLVTAIRQLFAFRAMNTALSIEGNATTSREREHLMIVIANGARIGGGFMIAPAARNDDGVLDLVRVGDASPWRRATLLASASRGGHVGAAEVTITRAKDVTLEFMKAPIFEADGELHQATSNIVTVRCVPGALRLAAPPSTR